MSEASSSTTTWTPAQLEAIRHVDGALLLSAAAGSGKTAVLANRCVHLVCDAAPPCEIDELLVLTFTRAAAAEMRERIERELVRRVNAAPEADERLSRQLRVIERAAITTIDAFCGDLVRSHFHVVGVDPMFSVLAPEDARLLKEDVCDTLLEAAYDEREAAPFKQLLDGYFNGDDAQLRRQIIVTYDFLQSVVEPDKWTSSAIERLDVGTRNAPGAIPRGVADLLQRHIATARRRLEQVVAGIAGEPNLAKYAAHAAELLGELTDRSALAAELNFDELADRVDRYVLPKLPTVRNDVPGKARAKDRIDAVKDSLKKGPIRSLGRWRWDDLRRDAQQVQESARTFFGFVDRFSDRYAHAKRGIRSLDFAEIERLALTILSEGGDATRPSSAAYDVQRRFRHVLVDEFQDINPMQRAILALASRDHTSLQPASGVRSNLFAVGDVKQSIYGFRLAEPRLFVERDRELRRGDASRGKVIDLQHNFRSRGPLLEAINDVFERLMTSASADVDYDDTQRLQAGAEYPAMPGALTFEGRPIELRLATERDDAEAADASEDGADDDEGEVKADRFDREVAVVARRIRELVCADTSKRQHVFVRTAAGLESRPVQYGDIAVLLRSARFKSAVVADALRAAGVPVHADDTSGFFQATEVQDVLSLLRVLSNRRQDVPLAALLRSPLSRLSDRDASLATFRIAYPDEPFHRAVTRYAAESAGRLAEETAAMLADIDRWRREVQERSIVDALNGILAETNYLTFCRALPGGEQRLANLNELIERAAAFDSFERQGLDRFLRFLGELEAEDQLGRPPLATGSSDVVRVMTVHKSKGLEFPIVIVPDLGKRFNERSMEQPILLDRDAGIGMNAVDLPRRIRYPSAPAVLVRDRARRQMLAEEIRVLYVALTRAREHLILVGTGKQSDLDAWRAEWSDHVGPLPDDFISSARTPLDWIGPIVAATERVGTFSVTFDAGQASDDDVSAERCVPATPAERLDAWFDASRATADLTHPPPAAAPAVARLSFVYPHDRDTRIGATAAVTAESVKAAAALPAIDRSFMRRDGDEPHDVSAEVDRRDELAWPEAYAPNRRARATEIGTAVHRVMQHLDFAGSIDDVQAIGAQLEQMITRRALAEAEAKLIDPNAILWFASTRLGRAIRDGSAGALRREQPLALARAIENATDPADFVLVRGRVDAMLVGSAGITLIDYKTDRVDASAVLERAGVYAPQLTAYSKAIAKITGLPVVGAYAVFFTPKVLVRLDEQNGVMDIVEADE